MVTSLKGCGNKMNNKRVIVLYNTLLLLQITTWLGLKNYFSLKHLFISENMILGTGYLLYLFYLMKGKSKGCIITRRITGKFVQLNFLSVTFIIITFLVTKDIVSSDISVKLVYPLYILIMWGIIPSSIFLFFVNCVILFHILHGANRLNQKVLIFQSSSLIFLFVDLSLLAYMFASKLLDYARFL